MPQLDSLVGFMEIIISISDSVRYFKMMSDWARMALPA